MSRRRSWGMVRQRQSSGKWEARYRDPAGEVHYRYFRTKIEATSYLSTVEADLLRGDWIDPRQAQRTLETWAADWMASKHDLRPRTRDLYEMLLRVHVLPTFGAMPLGSITTEAVDRWIAQAVEEGRGGTSVSRALRLMSQILNEAVRRRYLRFNPCAGAGRAPTAARRKVIVITPAQVADLADAVGARHAQYRTLVLLAAYGGLRWGEAVGLGTGQVNLLRATVTVERQMHKDGRIDEPKSEAGRRTVKVPRWLADLLGETIAARQPHPDLAPEHRELVFLNGDGKPIMNSNFNRREWRPGVLAALPTAHATFRFHDLRHTAVAIALESARRVGEPLNAKALQVRMGHSSITMTLDRYGHLLDGHDDAMVEGMADPYSNRPPAANVVNL